MGQFKGVCIGAGYFSHFQYEAWQRIPEVEITAMCNRNLERAKPIMEKYDVARHYTDYREMLDKEEPDFVDIITPPDTHLEMCKEAAGRGIHTICQKPLAPTFEEAMEIVRITDEAGIRFVVHENWRFQPWYREIKKLLDAGAIGNLHSLYFRSRMGDGWGEDAYLNRQPYFRDYPRLLVYENGVHFIDTYRYLAGEIGRVYARLRKLNPVIAGEDQGYVLFEFKNGNLGFWDANRYNESNQDNPRYTFGEFLVEGTGGAIRLYTNGNLTIQKLGEPETPHDYHHEDRGFAGDCCYAFQRDFVDRMIDGQAFETNGHDYLKTLTVQEAVYKSEGDKKPINLS
ncbi:gfo/Idh/MocA family oxidoreductase [bacterium]|nr:gfo/Idh/MocA family oxidoreductase [bacterium]